MSSIIGGLAKIPTAKILDTWGRPQGIGLMTFIWVIGYIMMATCKNVQTYAAAQVFSVTGYVCILPLASPSLTVACPVRRE